MARIVRAKLPIRVIVCAFLSLVLIVGGALAQSDNERRKIVIFANGISLERQLRLVKESGSQVLHTLWLIQALAIELPSVAPDLALAILLSSPLVTGVFPDLQSVADGSICIIPELPPVLEDYAWGLQHIYVPEVHTQWPDLQGAGVVVAILDTGIDQTHSDLKNRIGGGYNARAGENPKDYRDYNGHGTHMAGIIAATVNSLGVIGAAPKITLQAVKGLDDTGAGYESDVIEGLQWVYSKSIRLVNMSLGFVDDPLPLRKATQHLYNSGVIIVASAGNRCAITPSQDDGGDDDCEDGTAAVCPNPRIGLKYPAAYSWVIAVGASTFLNKVAAYSLTGTQLDILGPGGEQKPSSRSILSTTKDGGYGRGNGTSQAAAHVTGAVGLALQLKPHLTFAEVRGLLQTTAQDLGFKSEEQGAGLINVQKMLETLQ